MGSTRLYLEYELIDGNGRLLRKGRRRANSFVGNIIALLWSLMTSKTSGGTYNIWASRSVIIDTGNVARPLNINTRANANTSEHLFGIRVGTGTTAVAIDQYDLASPIVHGTAAGQLLYGITTIETITRGATEWLFRIIRTFSNLTDSTITVNEVGLFLLSENTGSVLYQFMLARDLILGLDIAPGATLTMRYVLSHSIS